jgi:hypothetical protein
MTFQDLMDRFKATPAERRGCAWFLAGLRMRRTVESCLRRVPARRR